MRGTSSFARFLTALGFGAIATVGAGSREAAAADAETLIEFHVDLRIVGPDAPENGPTAIAPLEGVEARLFVADGPPPAPADLPAEFQGKSIAAAKTSFDGSCVFGVPPDADVVVIFRWQDSESGKDIYVYSGVHVPESPPNHGLVEKEIHLIKLVYADGSVQYSSGQKHTVTG